MAYQHKTNITTKNSNTYATVDDFIAEHGALGLKSSSEFLVSANAILNDAKNGIVRTTTFDSEAAYNNWREVTRSFPGRQVAYTATLISQGDI